jgi:hypothetical protein
MTDERIKWYVRCFAFFFLICIALGILWNMSYLWAFVFGGVAEMRWRRKEVEQ